MHPGPAQRQKAAIGGERQFGLFDELVAPVIVAEQRLGASRDPFDRAPDPPRRPGDDGFFGIDLALHAETAADIAGDDADAAFRDMQDLVGEGVAHAVHMLGAGVERPAAGAGIILGEAAARLHRDGGDAVVGERQPRDMGGPREGRIDRRGVAHAQREPRGCRARCHARAARPASPRPRPARPPGNSW